MKKFVRIFCILLLLVIVSSVGYIAYNSLHGHYHYRDLDYSITESSGFAYSEPTLSIRQLQNTLSGYSIRFEGNVMIVETETQSGKKELTRCEVSFDGENVVLPEDFVICSVGNRCFTAVDTRTTTCKKSGKTIRFFVEEHYKTFTITSTVTFETVL